MFFQTLLIILCWSANGFHHVDLSSQLKSALDPISSWKTADKIKPLCIIDHCGAYLGKCLLSEGCRLTLNCFKKCTADDVQCNNDCFFGYSNPIFNQLTDCLISNHCLPGLVLSSDSCPNNGDIDNPKKGWENKLLLGASNKGKVYIARGWNPSYDCVPCQKATYSGVFDPNDDTIQLYTEWTTENEMGLVRSANYTLVQTGSNTLLTKYSLFGMNVEEHYYMLDWTNDGKWVMFYYCGYGFGSEYQGALLLTTQREFDTLPLEIESRFNKAIVSAGLSDYLGPMSDWCKPIYNTKCKSF